MKNKPIISIISIIFLIGILNLASAIVVDSTYITIFPGEEGRVVIEVDNNENFDIEDVSISLDLGSKKIFNEVGISVGETAALPFTTVGSSERNIDDIDEDDDDSVSFRIRASTDIVPGDYNIPYIVKYVNADDNDEAFEKSGSFGLRVSAKTEIDFALEVRGNAIINEEGKISLEIINKGLGEIKSISVQIFPDGYELMSKDKIFIGTIEADDTDIATFDVIYEKTNPTLSAKVEYKDFDNNKKSQTVNLPIKVYTKEDALELGLITESKTGTYVGIVAGILIVWYIFRKIKKRRKNKGRK